MRYLIRQFRKQFGSCLLRPRIQRIVCEVQEMIGDDPVNGICDHRVHSSRSRSPRRRLQVDFVAVALTAGLALASCTSTAAPSPSVSPGPRVSPVSGVPWTAAPAPARPSLATTGRPCAVNDLAVSSLAFAGYALGTEWFDGTVTLHAAASCDLPAEPAASLQDASGAGLAVPAAEVSADRIVAVPSSTLGVSLHLSKWCALKAQPRAADLTLLRGDKLHVIIADSAMAAAAPCAGSASYGSSFATTSSPSSTPSALSPITATLTPVSGNASSGNEFPYTITLTNGGSDTFSFNPCPAYDEGIKVASGYAVSYELNCAAAQPIAPGASETFDMSIAVPAGTPTGSYILSWSLEGTSIGANAQIEIK